MTEEIIVPVPAGEPPAKPAETPAAPASAVVPEPSKDKRGFDPVATANVMARQDKQTIEDTLGLLASKNPHGIFDAEPLKPADPKPPAQPTGPDEATKQLASEVYGLKVDNWTKDALMEFGLKPGDAKFLTGKNKQEIRASAQEFSERLKPFAAPQPSETIPGTAPETALPYEKPATYAPNPTPGKPTTPEQAMDELRRAEASGELADFGRNLQHGKS